MGGTGIGISDSYNLNFLNPASYTSIAGPSSSIFGIGMYSENIGYSTSVTSQSQVAGGLSFLSYWFRPSKRWASTIGLVPVTAVSYNISTDKLLAESTSATYTYSGSGYTNKVYWGNAFNITGNLSVGVNAGLLFGSVNRSESVSSTYNSDELTLTNRIHARKMTIDFGAQYKFHLPGKRTLSAGVIYDHGVTLYGNSTINLISGDADTLKTYTGNTIQYKLPRSVGAGISLTTEKSLLAADVRFRQWSEAGYSDRTESYRDTWRISAGYHRYGTLDAESIIKRLQFSAGAYVQDYNLKLRDTVLPNYGFTLGLALPVMEGRSTLGLSYGYDRFGTQENDLILQQSHRLSLDITIRDIWGARAKYD